LGACAGLQNGGATSPKSTASAASTRLVISVHDQRMKLLDGTASVADYLVSTAALGVSEQPNSYGTPRGRHAIGEKIGAGVAVGTVFVDRLPTDEIVAANTPGRADMATRILRLRGLTYENWAMFDRLIYIHGSPSENMLGKPASGGCIRMRSSEIVGLFDLVSVGTEVFIYEEPMETALTMLTANDARYADLKATAGVGVVKSIRQLCLGHGYGVDGIALSGGDAVQWCSFGAEQNDPVSIALLGSLYEEGKGVDVDLVKARETYARSAKLGNPHGQFRLSELYASGRGGAQDEALANEFLALAAKQGHTRAKALMQAEP
ncbi:MAG: L,D-transpeptidase family protein, partial [Burkholderiales bacterium]|nr:L,D-transpeptidase family protein [Burkholderiales bacterium]